MIDTFELFKIGVAELRRIFGDGFLKENVNNTTFSRGMASDNTYHFFAGFKTVDDMPGYKCNDHGWVLYALFLIDANTGEILECQYCNHATVAADPGSDSARSFNKNMSYPEALKFFYTAIDGKSKEEIAQLREELDSVMPAIIEKELSGPPSLTSYPINERKEPLPSPKTTMATQTAMNEKELEALDKASLEFFRDGKTETLCPRCGKLIKVYVNGNSYTVTCGTNNCLKDGVRGI